MDYVCPHLPHRFRQGLHRRLEVRPQRVEFTPPSTVNNTTQLAEAPLPSRDARHPRHVARHDSPGLQGEHKDSHPSPSKGHRQVPRPTLLTRRSHDDVKIPAAQRPIRHCAAGSILSFLEFGWLAQLFTFQLY